MGSSIITGLVISLYREKKEDFSEEERTAIVLAWRDLVSYIKGCLETKQEVHDITLKGKSRIGRKISKFLLGTESFLSSKYENFINNRGKSFLNKGNKFIDDRMVKDIYFALKAKKAIFGKSWKIIHEKFTAFWIIRFGNQEFLKIHGEQTTWIKETLYEGLRDIVTVFLSTKENYLTRLQVYPAFITDLLEPSKLKHHGRTDPGFSDWGVTRVETSSIVRLICEARLMTAQTLLDVAHKRTRGPLKSLQLTKAQVDSIGDLRTKIEDYLVSFIIEGSTGLRFHPLARDKLLFDIEIFYSIFKNTPKTDRSSISFETIYTEVKAIAKELGEESFGSRIGKYSKTPGYMWGTIKAINLYMRNLLATGRIKQSDYISFLKQGRVFCEEMGVSPAKPQGYIHELVINIEINHANIDALSSQTKSKMKAFINYLYDDKSLSEFFAELKKTSETFSISKLKDGFKELKKSKRLAFLQRTYVQSLEYGINHKDFGYLIKCAKIREKSAIMSTDSNLLKIVEEHPFSKTYNFQPSHELIQYLAYKNMPSIIVIEPLVYAVVGDKMLSGHIDFVQVIGNKIRIIDYKPDLFIDPNSDVIGQRSLINCFPQLGGYGILLDMMFQLRKAGFIIECVAFNENGYILFDPYKAIESTANFYYQSIQEFPKWSLLLPQTVLDKIKNSIP